MCSLIFIRVKSRSIPNVVKDMRTLFSVGDVVKIIKEEPGNSPKSNSDASCEGKVHHKYVTVIGVTENLVTVQYNKFWNRSYNFADLVTGRLSIDDYAERRSAS